MSSAIPTTLASNLSLHNTPKDDSTVFSRGINAMASVWAAGGVVMILANRIVRVVPNAVAPFVEMRRWELEGVHLGSYIIICLLFAYFQGYKRFQLDYAPLIVSRALTLKPLDGTPIHHIIFGPYYAIGLFHATQKRKMESWGIVIALIYTIHVVKRVPYPWENIMDASVAVVLLWGSLAIAGGWVNAVILGNPPHMDPELPVKDLSGRLRSSSVSSCEAAVCPAATSQPCFHAKSVKSD